MMLVLTVVAGSGLTMTLDNGERVRVKIVRVSGNKVRLGIDAPPDVDIVRDDVQQRIDNGESFAVSGHDGPGDMDGPQDAAATDGHVFQVPREGE
jgi:carbon storage regulator CsrA